MLKNTGKYFNIRKWNLTNEKKFDIKKVLNEKKWSIKVKMKYLN